MELPEDVPGRGRNGVQGVVLSGHINRKSVDSGSPNTAPVPGMVVQGLTPADKPFISMEAGSWPERLLS